MNCKNCSNWLNDNAFQDLRRRSFENATTASSKKLEKILGHKVTDTHANRVTPRMVVHMEEVVRWWRHTFIIDVVRASLVLSNWLFYSQTEKCVELLSDVMDILHRRDIGTTEPDISYLMQILLKPIIFSVGTIGDNDPLAVSSVRST